MITRLVTQEVTKSPTSLVAGLPTPLFFMPLESDFRILNGIGTATFTRSTVKLYLKRGTKLITEAAIDEGTFELNGYLGEGVSTWEALHNRDFTNAVHVKTNITPAKDAVGADGVANSASTLTATAANGTVFQTITKVSTENTFSLDVRRKTGTGTIEISDDGGSTSTDITASINSVSYTRFQITTTQANPSVGLRIVTSGDEIEVDYEGLEALPLASSRIEVTTTPVTRTADNLSIDAANIPAPTADYSLSATVDKLGNVNFDRIYEVVGETNRRMFIDSGGDLAGSHNAVSVSVGAVTDTISHKLVFTVASVNQTLFFDGIQVDQDAKGTVTGAKTSIRIGSQAADFNMVFGHIKNFRIDSVALTAAQVGTLP